KMRPPCNQADVRARARELYTEISTDCAGAVNADFHMKFSRSKGCKKSARFACGIRADLEIRLVTVGAALLVQAAACAADAVASSKAVETSRMLMTPIRL